MGLHLNLCSEIQIFEIKHNMMRVFIVTTTCAMLLTACLNTTDKEKSNGASVTPPVADNAAPAETTDPSKYTSIVWLDSSKNLGSVIEGEVVKISYRFRNSGSKPLVIGRVQPGCGCTVADYPKTPIAPGAEGEIKAEFNSQGREGVQNKSISVFANTAEQSYNLHFSVTVNKAKS